MRERDYSIAVVAGDGIGVDVIACARTVLEAAAASSARLDLSFESLAAGARCYQQTGVDMPAETVEFCDRADPILLGAIGDPSVRHADGHGLFQPAHGSAPDIAGRDLANPLAAVLSAALMPDYLGERFEDNAASAAGLLIEGVVYEGFAARKIRPIELGGDQGTSAVTDALVELVELHTVSELDETPR